MFPWNCYSNMDESTLGRFEACTFGIEVAENRIKSKFISNYKLEIPERTINFLPYQKRCIKSCNIYL